MRKENVKLKIISGMIQSSMVNNGLDEIEYDFICCVSQQLGLNQDIVDEYIENQEIFILPVSRESRVLKFYKTALHDKNLCKSYFKWIRASYRQGIELGLPQKIIRKFLYDIHFCGDYSQGEQIIKSYFSK
ncbi:hypothetical protein [Maribacter sp. Asnod2-G09]|uniref:hypothetical protein n=1 Tax=Maribacter sp. Asnod2-G09 TaxID=3160577 RepID=UPI0038706522